MVCIILDFILTHNNFKFMNAHMHQILGTSMGTKIAPPYANLFMDKEERTIILTFLHLIYFWKRFIDYIFFYFSGLPLTTQLLDDIHEYNQPHY